MNDFSEIEAELKKLRPRAVSPELAARVERALAQSDPGVQTAGVTKRRISWNWLPLGLGLAAAATFLLLARINIDRAPNSARTTAANDSQQQIKPHAQSTTDGSAASSFVPAGLTQVVYNTRDEGLHFPTGSNRPMRRIRSHKSETLQWQDPQTGASLRVTYPAEEVTLTPISGQ